MSETQSSCKLGGGNNSQFYILLILMVAMLFSLLHLTRQNSIRLFPVNGQNELYLIKDNTLYFCSTPVEKAGGVAQVSCKNYGDINSITSNAVISANPDHEKLDEIQYKANRKDVCPFAGEEDLEWIVYDCESYLKR